MKRRIQLVAACLVPATVSLAVADDLRVPGDHASLNAALAAAQPGDRVFVTGGTFRKGRISTPDVSVIGRRTRLTGRWEIDAPGVTIEGFTFFDNSLLVNADDVTVRRCRFLAARTTRLTFTRLHAQLVTGLVVEDCRVADSTITIVESPGTVFRGNRMTRGEVSISGDLATVEGNVLTRGGRITVSDSAAALVSRNRASHISVITRSERAVVEDNTVVGGTFGVGSDHGRVVRNRLSRVRQVLVGGDGVLVASNEFSFRTGRAEGDNLVVAGAGARVTDNVIGNGTTATSHSPRFLLTITGPGPVTVLRNRITHAGGGGILVQSEGSDVSANTLVGYASTTSIEVDAAFCTLTGNVVEQSATGTRGSSSIIVFGAETVLADNTVTGALSHGIYVAGSDCVLTGNEVRDSRRCGITIAPTADGTVIRDCIVAGADWAALCLLGTHATVSGSNFSGGRRADVVDAGFGNDLGDSIFSTIETGGSVQPFE